MVTLFLVFICGIVKKVDIHVTMLYTYDTLHMETIMNDMKQFTKNKTGYEIRSDILAMAKDYVEQSYYEEIRRLTILNGTDDTGKLLSGELPEMYDIDSILEIAEQMYTFVNQNSKSR